MDHFTEAELVLVNSIKTPIDEQMYNSDAKEYKVRILLENLDSATLKSIFPNRIALAICKVECLRLM